jgi:hypothetical protein
METSTGIIDYHLKERIEGQNLKITLSGRSPQDHRFGYFFQRKGRGVNSSIVTFSKKPFE